MDVIGLDATLVKGSHGLRSRSEARAPVLITREPLRGRVLDATEVFGVILEHLGLEAPASAPRRGENLLR